MRQELYNAFGEDLRILAIETRDRLNLTQKEIGKQLLMSESSYSDLETGETVCASALTETLLLTMQKHPSVFLNRVAERFEEALQPV